MSTSIQALVDQALLTAEAEKSKRQRSGKWSPSSFGRCYRYQYWNRKNEPISNPIDVEALRRFKVGTFIHDYFQAFFPTAQKEVKYETDDLIGFADIVLDNEVVDIKSCRSFEFKLISKPDFNVAESKRPNCLQVCSYALWLHKPQARLVFVEKDKLDSKEFVLEVAKFKPAIDEELEILRGYWKLEKLPPAIPRAFGGKECQYCSFMSKCFAMEGKTV